MNTQDEGLNNRLNHPAFRQPENLDSRVYRYLSLEKFLSLLNSSSLYFSSVSELNEPHEAAIPPKEIERRVQLWGKYHSHNFGKYVYPGIMDRFRVNCWTINENESDALWKLYGGLNHCSVAIASRYRKLCDLLCSDNEIYLGCVQYIDSNIDLFKIESAEFDPTNLFHPIMHKRCAFEHEREVRLLRWLDIGDPLIEAGFHLDVHLSELIECIYVNPYSEAWVLDVVASTVNKLAPELARGSYANCD